jgi:hypothetical protein
MTFSSRSRHHQGQRVQYSTPHAILPQAWPDSTPVPSHRFGKGPALFFEPREDAAAPTRFSRLLLRAKSEFSFRGNRIRSVLFSWSHFPGGEPVSTPGSSPRAGFTGKCSEPKAGNRRLRQIGWSITLSIISAFRAAAREHFSSPQVFSLQSFRSYFAGGLGDDVPTLLSSFRRS